MVYKQFDKVLDLAARTGDKVIVMSDNHEPYVVMTVKDYEGLIQDYATVKNLSEEELLDKINRDIAVWKASQEDSDDYDLNQFRVDNLKKGNSNDKASSSAKAEIDEHLAENNEDDKYYIEPVD